MIGFSGSIGISPFGPPLRVESEVGSPLAPCPVLQLSRGLALGWRTRCSTHPHFHEPPAHLPLCAHARPMYREARQDPAREGTLQTTQSRGPPPLCKEWSSALDLSHGDGHLPDHEGLPSLHRMGIPWFVGRGKHAPVIVDKDPPYLRPGGRSAPWSASIPTPHGRVQTSPP